ncbi:Shewanella-like protein phosphatase, partial [Skeletonema marinoi]
RPDLPKGQRIVAFGDVHGDITALRAFLVTAGILDPRSSIEEPVWCGGTTICVQTGDVLDRGDDELACFRLLATLARQAHDAGGQLLLLYGNHESLNAAGLFQYANPGGNVEFERTIGQGIDYNYGSNRWRLQFAGNQPSRWASFEPGGLLSETCWGICS